MKEIKCTSGTKGTEIIQQSNMFEVLMKTNEEQENMVAAKRVDDNQIEKEVNEEINTEADTNSQVSEFVDETQLNNDDLENAENEHSDADAGSENLQHTDEENSLEQEGADAALLQSNTKFVKQSWADRAEDVDAEVSPNKELELTPPTHQAMDNEGFQPIKSKARAMTKKNQGVSNYRTRYNTGKSNHY